MHMNIGKNTILFALILSIYITTVSAAAFDVSVVPLNDKISIDEFAKFEIVVKNNMQQADEFRLYTSDFPIWDVRTEPLVNPITLNLRPGEEGSVELIVDPLKIRDIGTYAVNLNVRSRELNQLKAIPLKVTVLSTEGLIGGYVPTVLTSVGVPERLDPRDALPIKIILNNQNFINYEELVIKVESEFFEETLITKLGPKDSKTLEIIKNLDPLTNPQELNLLVSVFANGRSVINPIPRLIEVVEYVSIELLNEKKRVLSTKSTYLLESNNPDSETEFKVETTVFGSIFSSSPNAKVLKEDGKRYFVWTMPVSETSMQVTVNENLLPLFVVIILTIASVISRIRVHTIIFGNRT